MLGQKLDQVSERRAQRAHVVRKGVQHADDGHGSVVVVVVPLQLDADIPSRAAARAIIRVPPVRSQAIASVLATLTDIGPGHGLPKLVLMSRIEDRVQAGMIEVGGARVTPNGQVAQAQGQRMTGA